MEEKKLHALGALLTVIGGALVATSSLAPWASISTVAGKISISGFGALGSFLDIFKHDGFYVAILGILCVVFGMLAFKFKSRAHGILPGVFAIVALAIGILNIVFASLRFEEASAVFGAPISLQWGLFVLVIACLVVISGSALVTFRKHILK